MQDGSVAKAGKLSSYTNYDDRNHDDDRSVHK